MKCLEQLILPSLVRQVLPVVTHKTHRRCSPLVWGISTYFRHWIALIG
jgi:hypothetical protein